MSQHCPYVPVAMIHLTSTDVSVQLQCTPFIWAVLAIVWKLTCDFDPRNDAILACITKHLEDFALFCFGGLLFRTIY